MPQNADPAVLGDGPVSLPAHAVQMQGVRAYDAQYLSREEERRRERVKERERERDREARRQKEAAPKQVLYPPMPPMQHYIHTGCLSASLPSAGAVTLMSVWSECESLSY